MLPTDADGSATIDKRYVVPLKQGHRSLERME